MAVFWSSAADVRECPGGRCPRAGSPARCASAAAASTASDVAPDKGDAVVDLDDSFVFPGLINAHDHLELNSQPRLKWRERYDNASEWIADFQPRFETDPALAVTRPDTLDDRVWVGGLKNLLSGVTTVCHHNPMHRPLRQTISGSRGRRSSATATRCTLMARRWRRRIGRHRATGRG